MSAETKQPTIDPTARIAEGAIVRGDVQLGADASIWYNAVLRGDVESITVGSGSNIQDGCVVHVDAGAPVHIGEMVTIGHGAIVHGCTIGDGALIGMGAIILNGAVIGEGCIVGAGTLVTQGKHIPAGTLVMGSPARMVRAVTAEEREHNLANARLYIEEACTQL